MHIDHTKILVKYMAVQHWSRIFEVGTSYMNMLNMCWTRGGDINSDSVQLYRGFPSTIFFRDDELAPSELGVEYHISLVVTPLKGGYTRFSDAKRDAQSGKVIRKLIGPDIPTSITVPAGHCKTYEFTYRGNLPSGSEEDITVHGEFHEYTYRSMLLK